MIVSRSVAAVMVIVALALSGVASAGAQTAETSTTLRPPEIGVTPPTSPIGSTVRVNLNYWPDRFVTVTVSVSYTHLTLPTKRIV